MTNEQLESIGYYVVISDKTIVESSYSSYLSEYGHDDKDLFVRETTTLNEEDEEVPVLEIRQNKYGGGSRLIDTYDNKEDADLRVWESLEFGVNDNWNAPAFHGTKEDAIQDIADSLDKPFEVLKRYIIWSEQAAAKHAIAVKEYQAKDAIRREQLKQDVLAEANSITIDTEFKNDMVMAQMMAGMAKNDFCAKAMTDFLKRNNIEKITSDFWQVFRILKGRC